MGHNPFDGVSRFSEGTGSVRFLSEEERQRLLAETVKDEPHTFHCLGSRNGSTCRRAVEAHLG